MKKILASILVLMLIGTTVFAQQLQKETTYPLVIKFQSHCCGVPDDTPLRKWLVAFKKQYKIRKITADKIGPMGKEGEYYLAFSLKGFTRKQKTAFLKKVKIVTAKMKDQGSAVCEENMLINPSDLPSRSGKETIRF